MSPLLTTTASGRADRAVSPRIPNMPLPFPADDLAGLEGADRAAAQMARNLKNRDWRLNNLYYIIDKHGQRVKFRWNPEQEQLYEEMHYLNVILKARQLGFTTFIALFFLDECLHNSHVRAGIIAHTLPDATKILRDKIKFAYESLPEQIRGAVTVTRTNESEIFFSNNSIISVSTSYRSGTANLLHVSEFGKLGAKFPDKAREIITGSLPALASDGLAFFESTAEGAHGKFHDMCIEAMNRRKQGTPLSEKDFKFHFFPWYHRPEYAIPTTGVIIPSRISDYFRALAAKLKYVFTPEQIAWYTKTEQTLGADMRREYPATPEEAFEQAVEGCYYATQMTWLRENKRICAVPHDPSAVVDTYWDLGMSDYMTIVFAQRIGREYHLIDYYEASEQGFDHYAKVLRDKGYRYGRHVGPHDIKQREFSNDGESRQMTIAKRYGISFDSCPCQSIFDGIEQVRAILPLCWIDETKCADMIAHLDMYRKEWNDRTGVWSDKPRHDEHSHCADAIRTFGVAVDPHTSGHKSTVQAGPSIKNWVSYQ